MSFSQPHSLYKEESIHSAQKYHHPPTSPTLSVSSSAKLGSSRRREFGSTPSTPPPPPPVGQSGSRVVNRRRRGGQLRDRISRSRKASAATASALPPELSSPNDSFESRASPSNDGSQDRSISSIASHFSSASAFASAPASQQNRFNNPNDRRCATPEPYLRPPTSSSAKKVPFSKAQSAAGAFSPEPFSEHQSVSRAKELLRQRRQHAQTPEPSSARGRSYEREREPNPRPNSRQVGGAPGLPRSPSPTPARPSQPLSQLPLSSLFGIGINTPPGRHTTLRPIPLRSQSFDLGEDQRQNQTQQNKAATEQKHYHRPIPKYSTPPHPQPQSQPQSQSQPFSDGGNDSGSESNNENMPSSSRFWEQAASAIGDTFGTMSMQQSQASGKPRGGHGGGLNHDTPRGGRYSGGNGGSMSASRSAEREGRSDRNRTGGSSRGGRSRYSNSPASERRDPTMTSSQASNSSVGMAGGGPVPEEVDTTNMPSVSSDDPTDLYSLIKGKDWDGAISQARGGDHRGEAGTWVVEQNQDGSARWRLLPLHQACEMQPPVEAIQALLMAYPPAVTMRDSGGDLPLHLACRERASRDVIDALLQSDPDTSRVSDDEGRLPIHLACRQGAGLDIVQRLLVTHHRGSKEIDSYGLLPLHWACAQNASVPVVEALLRANPYAVDVKDKWGRSPLSLAQASTNSEKGPIVTALNRDPSYWTTSLMEEVDELKEGTRRQMEQNQQANSKASSLEAKLAEVMAVSTSAAMSFQELRNELESENSRLKGEVEDLTPRLERSEERVDFLEEENGHMRGNVEELVERLGAMTEVFRAMEEQRLTVLRVTGDWEESLSRAAELVLIDDIDRATEGGDHTVDVG